MKHPKAITATLLFGLLSVTACGGGPSDVYQPSALIDDPDDVTTSTGSKADDPATTGQGGGGGGDDGASSVGAGGDGAGGTAPGPDEEPNGAVCEGQALSEVTLPSCGVVGARDRTYSGAVTCPAGPVEQIVADVFTIDAAPGDCIHVRVDNAGSSGADMMVVVAEAVNGAQATWDDEWSCSVPNVNGYGCAEGASTVDATGPVHIIVASWDGIACPAGQLSPYQLDVSVNGVGVDLSDGPSCDVDINDL